MQDSRADRSGPGRDAQPAPRLSEAYRTGWRLFAERPGAFLVGVLAWGAILLVVAVALFPLLRLTATGDVTIGPDGVIHDTGGILGFAIASVVYPTILFFVATVALTGVAHAALVAIDGGRVEFRDFFGFPNTRSALAWAAINAVAGGILTMTIVGTLVWFFFAFLVVFFVVAKNMRTMDALRAGFSLAGRSVWTTIPLYLTMFVAFLVGAALVGVGLLLTVPLAMIANAYVFRRLIEA